VRLRVLRHLLLGPAVLKGTTLSMLDLRRPRLDDGGDQSGSVGYAGPECFDERAVSRNPFAEYRADAAARNDESARSANVDSLGSAPVALPSGMPGGCRNT